MHILIFVKVLPIYKVFNVDFGVSVNLMLSGRRTLFRYNVHVYIGLSRVLEAANISSGNNQVSDSTRIHMPVMVFCAGTLNQH